MIGTCRQGVLVASVRQAARLSSHPRCCVHEVDRLNLRDDWKHPYSPPPAPPTTPFTLPPAPFPPHPPPPDTPACWPWGAIKAFSCCSDIALMAMHFCWIRSRSAGGSGTEPGMSHPGSLGQGYVFRPESHSHSLSSAMLAICWSAVFAASTCLHRPDCQRQ